MNPIIKLFAFAGVLLLGACGSGNANDANDANDVLNGGAGFSARTFTVPRDLSDRVNSRALVGDTPTKIAYDYIENIPFELHNETTFDARWIRRGYNGILLISLTDEINRLHLDPPMTPAFGAHIFAGILYGTDFGVPLSANATFRGSYRHLLIVSSNERRIDFEFEGRSDMITLEADFDAKTLTGVDIRGKSNQSKIEINGKFSEGSNILSGSVTVAYTNSDRNFNESFTAPLSGVIGVVGAAGVFSNYENTGDGEGYAFGGGFVVDNCTIDLMYYTTCPNN